MLASDEQRARLTLLRTPSLGPATLRRILVDHQHAATLAQQTPLAALCGNYGLGPAARSWLENPDAETLDADQNWLQAADHHLLCFDDADFPPLLDDIDQPPALLFVHGQAEALLQAQIAIVGSRAATPQGIADSHQFAAQLAAGGLVVTSGMADGIDGAAHAAALEAGGTTIAVLGTGVDRVYPRKHAELARRIAEQGALVSEFPLGTGPRAEHFPRRNRILAGMALGTLVVEAGLRSGSLITARLASEQGREVMALPGSIHNRMKQGCHRLIRDGATLVEQPAEVREILAAPARQLGKALATRLAEHAQNNAPQNPRPQSANPPMGHDPEHAALLAALGHDPQPLDVLAARTKMDAAKASALLLDLELSGAVARLAGGRYQRLETGTDNHNA